MLNTRLLKKLNKIVSKEAWIRSMSRRMTNPGIRHRMKIIDDPNAAFDLEELEADFNHLQASAKEHRQELQKLKKVEQYNIIRDKYFKEKQPNFLTWSDKKHIQYLHNENPEEWSIDKLSEAFPALPDTIKKIVKAKWDKKNESRIRKHDEVVQQNWKEFKNGRLSVPKAVEGHLNKFMSRDILSSPLPQMKQEKGTIALVQGEFSHIISSYQKIKDNATPKIDPEETHQAKQVSLNENFLENFSKKRMKHKQLLTCNEVIKELENEIDTMDDSKIQTIDSEIQTIDSSLDENVISIKSEEIKAEIDKFAEKSSKLVSNSGNFVNQELNYPERIVIPKNKVKHGSTYKLNDCYYDSDGEFLYRVPGMH